MVVIDSQGIKAVHAKERGYDAGRKVVGRKRHIAVNTDGRLRLMDRAAFPDFTGWIIHRFDTAKGFEILPRR
ncbi:hypothetical protein MSKU9_0183 [Komagataeibacter diospyri]|uniref:Transposase IS4-like domain-containing protein n=1 Tax=Komagataeibacter diospyri TaxID=1932662 RepID=A0A4V0WM10_9PROT|nr:hypothetical protein MSKU9_0183 [Komagataeibacter diospyri]